MFNPIRQFYWIVLLLLAFPSSLFAKKPDWVERQPVHPEYYIGIASAEKSAPDNEHVQVAKDKALKQIASEITVNISGEFVQTMVEKSGMIQQDVLSQIRSSTKASLEGFELVDTWQDDTSYWVYYRLSKSLYQATQQKKRDRATSSARDFYKKALQNEQNGNIAMALSLNIKALNQLDEYLMEPLETELNGRKVFLANEIYSQLQTLVNRLTLTPLNSNIKAKTGAPLNEPLSLQVSAMGATKPGRFPIIFKFTRGAGQMVSTLKTNDAGMVYNRVNKITAIEKLQVVEAAIDMDQLISTGSSKLLTSMILNLQPPKAKYILTVSGLAIKLNVQENHFSKPAEVLYVEPKLKNKLSQKGFSFVSDPAQADIIINCEADSRKGMSAYGMNSAYVDLRLSVLDLKTGEEIYKNSLTNIKGMHLDFNKASVKAFQNAADKVAELLPEMIEKIQK